MPGLMIWDKVLSPVHGTYRASALAKGAAEAKLCEAANANSPKSLDRFVAIVYCTITIVHMAASHVFRH